MTRKMCSRKMDAIANAVSDSCEPAIISDSTLQTVDGKTVIVVEICRADSSCAPGAFCLSVMERIIRLMLLLFWLATEDFMLQRKSHVENEMPKNEPAGNHTCCGIKQKLLSPYTFP